jgi:hypothetical protein
MGRIFRAGHRVSALLSQYREMAATGRHFRGLTLLTHADRIGTLVRRHKAVTLLDYGSGAGDAYDKPHQLHKRWGVPRPLLYDPAFVKYRRLPTGTFHGVFCSDVLEHVEEAAVDKLVSSLFAYAERFVFASVCCRPAAKNLPDGRNAHITLHPLSWWLDVFRRHQREGVNWVLVETQ